MCDSYLDTHYVHLLIGRGSGSFTPSNAAFRARDTAASVLETFEAVVLEDSELLGSDFNFSRAISYAMAAFSRVSKTPIYRDFPA
mmetsp:Transcript_14455/g.28924  ORF Transcript_14455/g.28924 Transcript_14455/m.28924 type:complete len:85 (-) Transcript_14455:656-910(-)